MRISGFSVRSFVRGRTLVLLAILLSAVPLQAQQADTAIVLGRVLDADTAVIPGAVVRLTHLATNTATTTLTDERGQYRTPPLRPGEYEIIVDIPGFSTFTQRGVVLNIGDVRQVDAVLQVGEFAQAITVVAETPLLQTADSTVGTVITSRQITELPLASRDYLQLAALTSGVMSVGDSGVSVGGQAGRAAAFLLDGQDNNNQQIATSHSSQKEVIKPSVDAIQEFKIVTNGYSAEYGRSSSGVISAALKSGTNQYHGTLYHFLRNDALDATNYFAASKAPYRRNQFGFTLGGPIVRNKTFFFGDFEGGVIRRSTVQTSTLPSEAMRAGLFPSTITDPLTRQPFLGNQIPQDRIDPVSARILQYVPLPQRSTATNNYVYNSPQHQDSYQWDFRIDHVLSERQNLYFRYSYQKTEQVVSSPLPPHPQVGYYSGNGDDYSRGRSFVLVHNYVWTNNLVSSFRAGWNDIFWTSSFPDQQLAGVGIPGVDNDHPGFSSISITGYRGLGVTNVPNTDGSQTRQLSGDLSWTRGNHTLKFGTQAYWLQTNFHSSQRSSGTFNFNGQYSGNAFADFLLGYANQSSLSKWAHLQFRSTYAHFFVQDDWRATRRLTLNLGLRYELSLPPVEKHDNIANFDMDTDPANPRIVLAGQEGSDRASRALQGVNWKQFAPRFGFAYSLPDNRTVIRGGYGIFFSNMITVGGMQSMEINPPNHLRVVRTTDRNAAPTIVLSEGFSAGALSPALATDVNLVSHDRSNVTPTAQQWNLNIQRELPGGALLEIGYNANKFDHDWRQLDGNPAPPGPGNINSRRPFKTAFVPGSPEETFPLANVTRVSKDGYSRYHALLAKVEKRYSRGLSILASYAWSKTIEFTGAAQDPLNQRAERALSSRDRAHHFVASGSYELPVGRNRTFGSNWGGAADAILGGWSLSPILTITSGAPLNLSVNGDPSNTGQPNRPNVVGEWRIDNPTIDRWFNTDAFEANAPFTYGNAGKNILRGPGYFNLDVALRKAFQVSEQVTAELRLESFNATNARNFGNPNTQVGNINFGRISSAGSPRSNQVALKISF